MQDWIKIQTFDRVHQAELRKDILEQNGIEAVVINETDSLFLLGHIELYVRKKDKAKANALIDEFYGLTKINSFILYKPMKRLYDLLKEEGINIVLMEKEENGFVLENYELFVENDKIDLVVPYLTGEKLTNWTKIESCQHTRQVRFRVEILEDNAINAIVIKKKDSNLHVEEINIYVENDFVKEANEILYELKNWKVLKTYDKLYRAEIREDLLGKNSIKGIIRKNDDNEYDLFVQEENTTRATDVINSQKNWLKVATYNNSYKAQVAKEKLENENIDTVIIDKKDSMFLLGEFYLFVDELMIDRATKILS